MAIALKFTKPDNDSQWGFRLVGGADFETPLVVVKVNEDSLAEHAGLQEGDIIVRINETPTAGLTHTQAHELLSKAGNEFELGIRRGDILFYQQWVNDIENNVEVSEILNNIIKSEQKPSSELLKIIAEEEKGISASATIIKADIKENNIVEYLSSEETINKTTISNTENAIDRKWSTFLQRPNNLKPIPKKEEEERKILGEPYRVVIKKQKRKTEQEKKVAFEDNDTIINESEIRSNVNEEETDELEFSSEIMSSEIEVELKVTEKEEIDIYEEIGSDIEESGVEIEEIEETITGIQTESVLESSYTLEEQLIQVQKQLQALSQLPSAIQVTLDAVSQQLAQIVGVKQAKQEENGNNEENNNNHMDDIEERNEDEASISDRAEEDITDKEDNDNQNQIEEELAHDEKVEMEDSIENPEDKLSEEEKEARIIEEEKVQKKQKEMDLRPIQRPIILPGGRKWTEPDDACPSVRNPKMTDEKIATTIETYSEVIVGKAKGLTTGIKSGHGLTSPNPYTGFGFCRESNCYKVPSKAISSGRINFLKYQPPPKNLDYLQRSEVYRLVHDMEPPVRGISTRVEKILAEQDYMPHGAP